MDETLHGDGHRRLSKKERRFSGTRSNLSGVHPVLSIHLLSAGVWTVLHARAGVDADAVELIASLAPVRRIALSSALIRR